MSTTAVFSSSLSFLFLNTTTPKSYRCLTFKPYHVGTFPLLTRSHFPFLASSVDNVTVIDEMETVEKAEVLVSNGSAFTVPKFRDARWIAGTWDLEQFKKGENTDWDAVIDAEVRRRKWLKDHLESSSKDDPVVFRSSIIPWWPWVKRFHLPEAELLNGRAAMIGIFMAYLVECLTGIGLVDQMNNFFCKTLMFVTVVGVLLIRKNEDIQNLKDLSNEITMYDKQWQAAWKEDDRK